MKYDKKLNKLVNENIDEEYAKFHSNLIPNKKIKGVRFPILRKIAKEFAKYDDFLENVTLDSYEAISIACCYIGLRSKDLKTLKSMLDFILPYVDNWSVCDTLVSSIKILKKKNKEFLPELYQYLNTDNDWIVRFVFVCFMSYYAQDDDLIEELLNLCPKYQDRSYYSDMGIAWFVSVAFVKCRDKTLKFLQKKLLSPTVQNKSISKICDSFRVNKDDKNLVKTLRY